MIPSSAHDAYLESKILAADPLDLVRILYRTALGSAREARVFLANGDVPGRSRSISRALEALAELNGSLNQAVGGDVSRRLAGLYDYMQRLLLQANYEQTEGPLTEVAGLLATLLEAWEEVKLEPQPSPAGHNSAEMVRWGIEDVEGARISARA